MFTTQNFGLSHIDLHLSQGSIFSWLLIASISLIVAYAIKLVLRPITKQLRKLTAKTGSIWDDIALDIIDGLRIWVLFIWVLYFFPRSFTLMAPGQRLLTLMVVVASSYQVGLWGLYLIRIWQTKFLCKRIEHDPSSAAALGLLATTIQAVFIVILLLLSLSNLGINVSALVAGLGVGGIAVALAAQNILGDLFASLSIILDKPFVVGDFISSSEATGTVQQVGIKTTRLQSLSGEQLVISNKDLMESRIKNFKRMTRRRIVKKFGVLYSTPSEKLEKIPTWIQDIIKKHDLLTYDRCHFADFGASSLDYELVFFVENPEYNVYMDLQQKVLVEIFQKFEAEQIGFAFPTQSLYIERTAKSPERKDTPSRTEPLI